MSLDLERIQRENEERKAVRAAASVPWVADPRDPHMIRHPEGYHCGSPDHEECSVAQFLWMNWLDHCFGRVAANRRFIVHASQDQAAADIDALLARVAELEEQLEEAKSEAASMWSPITFY